MNFRACATGLLAALWWAAACHASAAAGDNYPTKPVHVVVFVAPGGSADAVARMLGEGLGQSLGQPVVVENKPGAGGNLSTQYVSRATPDGHTLLLTANNHTVNPALYANAGYALSDLVPIASLMEGPSVIVVPADSKYRTLGDLLADARGAPNRIAFGSAGVGSPSHIAGELLQRSAGVKLNHVAYRGSGPSLQDAMSNQIPVAIASLVAAAPQLEGGRLRALAVTSRKRWPSLPNVPAAAEFGLPDYEHITWLGLFAPKGTPAPVVDRLGREVQQVMNQDRVAQRIGKLGGAVPDAGRAAFAEFVQRDYEASTKLVRELQLKADQ